MLHKECARFVEFERKHFARNIAPPSSDTYLLVAVTM